MTRPQKLTRRAILGRAGLASLGAGLSGWLALAESRAQGGKAPARFMMMTRPNGTYYPLWMPADKGPNFVLPTASAPFESVRQHMTMFADLDLILAGENTTPFHETNMVCMLTGGPVKGKRSGDNDWKNVNPSVDQHLKANSPHFQNHEPLYLVGDYGVDNSNPQVANRAAGYKGADDPIFPEATPLNAYNRLFAGLMPGGATGPNIEALAATRRREKSVLDLVQWDLQKVKAAAPVQERDQLDRHAEMIRELETRLDAVQPQACTVPGAPPQTQSNEASNVETDGPSIAVVGQLHLDLVRTVFSCDLTRQVMFMWTSAASNARWRNWYPNFPNSENFPDRNHHALSHMQKSQDNVQRAIAAVDNWFSTETTKFITKLKAAMDVDGTSMLSNTLVLYASSIRDGDHVATSIPVAMFGGENLGHTGGRIYEANHRPMNDLWLAIANQLEAPLQTLGTTSPKGLPQTTGLMDGVFV